MSHGQTNLMCTGSLKDLGVDLNVCSRYGFQAYTELLGVSNHWNGVRTGLDWNGMERYGIAK